METEAGEIARGGAGTRDVALQAGGGARGEESRGATTAEAGEIARGGAGVRGRESGENEGTRIRQNRF